MKAFEGWYFKHQKGGHTLSIIAGRAQDGAFIQAITKDASYHIEYPHMTADGARLCIGGSTFSPEGARLYIQNDALRLSGAILYEGITPLKSDIMGPFKYLPMQCRHSIVSMRHNLSGGVMLNGQRMDFDGGVGYMEGDSGSAFPRRYTWLQCNDFAIPLSVSVSVADIPFMGARFTGCICAIWLDGEEYRLATYKGVRILRAGRGVVELEQAPYRFSAHIGGRAGHRLFAPAAAGRMTRVIHEDAACDVRVRLYKDGRILFDEESNGASYEYADGH